MFAPVYLDHNATTPLDPLVREAMLPWLGARFGNASSRHEYGRAARKAIDEARSRVAAAVNAHPTEVIFTSGGSEANNLFIKGAAAMMKPGLVALSAIEHPCVREPARQLMRSGWCCEEIAVDGSGRIDPQAFDRVLADKPRIVSVMLANNETGVIQNVEVLAGAIRKRGGWMHCDAVQALGKIPVDFRALGVHGLTLSAHKIHGPLGVGALIVDKRVELAPLVAGGGQERSLRSGTENVMAIVGFATACDVAVTMRNERSAHLAVLRDALERGLTALGARLFSAEAPRLPNTSFFAIPGVDGDTLVGRLDRAGFAVASGSACSSADPEPSHTLLSMGVDPELARAAVRVSLGAGNTRQDVDGFLAALGESLASLRTMTAVAV
ncbi:cysteine desulfurase family protein [Zoogloea sp.]|uniref:cysteine desulfurase family protein n=1 Tax=Zoogloea sp. TaxID=49181 RepID=UPI001B626CD4|nr:cysteine desulfurase family protein [Zoogloea sp.]MBK6652949.1 cysteine desulfurase [Zoogloea sp.]MBP7444501.1 cysteine desulfurase [Zoogloea sp.]HOY00439.1 cysteine desulfurase family protein [Zoogloea sp.]HPI58662.1 cysteine desulfurase family protein [Zoogloea sp.]